MLDKCIKRCYFLIGLKDYLYSDLLFGYKAFMKGKLMNKYGHVTVTKRLTPKLKKRHDFALRLGSIMPDILLHTYIKGHTWDSSYNKVSRRLQRLERHGRMNCFSFLSLGYALHYIEDYFTFPHNSWYPEPMSEHVLYEIKFMNYIFTKFLFLFFCFSNLKVIKNSTTRFIHSYFSLSCIYFIIM